MLHEAEIFLRAGIGRIYVSAHFFGPADGDRAVLAVPLGYVPQRIGGFRSSNSTPQGLW